MKNEIVNSIKKYANYNCLCSNFINNNTQTSISDFCTENNLINNIKNTVIQNIAKGYTLIGIELITNLNFSSAKKINLNNIYEFGINLNIPIKVSNVISIDYFSKPLFKFLIYSKKSNTILPLAIAKNQQVYVLTTNSENLLLFRQLINAILKINELSNVSTFAINQNVYNTLFNLFSTKYGLNLISTQFKNTEIGFVIITDLINEPFINNISKLYLVEFIKIGIVINKVGISGNNWSFSAKAILDLLNKQKQYNYYPNIIKYKLNTGFNTKSENINLKQSAIGLKKYIGIVKHKYIENTLDSNCSNSFIKCNLTNNITIINFEHLQSISAVISQNFQNKNITVIEFLLSKLILALTVCGTNVNAVIIQYPFDSENELNSIYKNLSKLFNLQNIKLCIQAYNNITIWAGANFNYNNNTIGNSFRRKGDFIFLLGQPAGSLNASLYGQLNCVKSNNSYALNNNLDAKLNLVVKQLISNNLILSAIIPSIGGLFIAIIEACYKQMLGFDITTDAELDAEVFLFGEDNQCIIVSVDPEFEVQFIDVMINSNVPFSALGHVTKEELRIDDQSYGFITDLVF